MKSERFDCYIAELETRLKSLMPQQRQDEMREVRQHLEDLALWHMQQGRSADDAVELALKQFGRAEAIGAELSGAVKEVRVRSQSRTLFGFAAYWVAIFALEYLFFYSMADKPTDFPYLAKDKLVLSAVAATSALAGACFMRRWRERRKLIA